MKKTLLSLLLILSFFGALAQKDTVVYYLKNNGKVVTAKDSADFFVAILPPDTSIDKNLYRVNEFYPNGKLRLLGGSLTKTMGLKFQGTQITFYQNGHKMKVASYDNGQPVGDLIGYYPNGKLYYVMYQRGGRQYYDECRDSTGKILAKNGNGHWVYYFNEKFDNKVLTGDVRNGREEGEWKGRTDDSSTFVSIYKSGSSDNTVNFDNNGKKIEHKPADEPAGFQGGPDLFSTYVMQTIIYPQPERDNGIQGQVIVSFFIEKDGALTDITVTKGVNDALNKEALRIIRRSPKWLPGTVGGESVRSPYSVPINFTIFKGLVMQTKNRDTAVYFLTSDSRITFLKDSIAYYQLIIPPDKKNGRNLYTVEEFYANGKLSFKIPSKSNKFPNFGYDGQFVSYYSTGNKKKTIIYEAGQGKGDETEYYPNGKIYQVKLYNNGKPLLLNECRDSTGKVLAANGNGHWIDYLDDNFSKYFIEGEVANGAEEGDWKEHNNDNSTITRNYKNGWLTSISVFDAHGQAIFKGLDDLPGFPGGLDAFGMFLVRNLRYPVIARENGIEGIVMVAFTVEKDGTLDNFHIEKGIGNGFDEEAIRVMSLSPKWKPGTKYGKRASIAYSVPIAFTLAK